MTKKEAEKIAWELIRIIEVPEGGPGIYSAAPEIANAAGQVVSNLIGQFPKIAEAVKKLTIKNEFFWVDNYNS